MKKVLIVIAIVFLLILSIPVYIWWVTLQPLANVSYSQNTLPAEELSRIHQFIQKNEQTPNHKRIELSQHDLNQLIRYGSQKINSLANVAGYVELHPDNSQLLLTLNTGLPLRPYLNAQFNFITKGKNIVLLGGRFGGMNLPQQGVELLVNMTIPYAQQHQQYSTGTQLLQTIEAITVQDKKLSIDFIINQQVKAAIQQQLEIILGKDALNRLPFYQQVIEQSFQQRLGQRVKLHQVMQELFNVAVTERNASPMSINTVADNKAILFALFLHTIESDDAAFLQSEQMFSLPQQPIEFTIERRKDLAQHYLGTAVITLFANSAIADTIGLYKELQDQNGPSGFSASDLIADRAGSLLASQLLNPATAKHLQQRIAATQNELELFPNTRIIAPQLEQQMNQHQGDQQQVIYNIEQHIDQLAKSVAIYQ